MSESGTSGHSAAPMHLVAIGARPACTNFSRTRYPPVSAVAAQSHALHGTLATDCGASAIDAIASGQIYPARQTACDALELKNAGHLSKEVVCDDASSSRWSVGQPHGHWLLTPNSRLVRYRKSFVLVQQVLRPQTRARSNSSRLVWRIMVWLTAKISKLTTCGVKAVQSG